MFSERLTKLRKERSYSQEELGNFLNLSKSTIAMYETGRREPDHETLDKIANFFKVSTDYLLGRTGERRSAETVIKEAISDDPELLEFFQELSERDDLQIMFKQTKNLSSDSIRRIIKYIKMVEDEEAKE